MLSKRSVGFLSGFAFLAVAVVFWPSQPSTAQSVASVEPEAPTVTAMMQDDLRANLVGQIMSWRSTEGPQNGHILLKADGTAVMSTNLEGLPIDRGSWRLEGPTLCTRWGIAREGAEKCYTVSTDGFGRFITSGGNVFEVFAPTA